MTKIFYLFWFRLLNPKGMNSRYEVPFFLTAVQFEPNFQIFLLNANEDDTLQQSDNFLLLDFHGTG
jgi:hypothetical protein